MILIKNGNQKHTCESSVKVNQSQWVKICVNPSLNINIKLNVVLEHILTLFWKNSTYCIILILTTCSCLYFYRKY